MGAELSVLVLTPDYPPAPGGIQATAYNITRHASGLRPRVVTLDGPRAGEFDAAHDTEVIRVRRRLSHSATVGLLNVAAVRTGCVRPPDLVLSVHVVTAPAARILQLWLRLPIVQYFHADEIARRPRISHLAAVHADAVIAVSRYSAELAREAGAPPERLHIVTPGVDVPANPMPQPTGSPLIVSVARLAQRYKGHDVLIRAMPLIRARVPDTQLVVIGDGPLRPFLRSLADAHGLGESVTFTGEVTDAARDEWLRRARVLALPSRLRSGRAGGEGFGIVFREAGAHWLPAVGGAVGGALDAIEDNVTGRLVAPEDPVALGDAIADLLLDPQWARQLGVEGRRRAEANSWPAVAEKIADILRGTASGD